MLMEIERELLSTEPNLRDRTKVLVNILSRLQYLGCLILERGIVKNEVEFFDFWSSITRITMTLPRLHEKLLRGNREFIFAK